VPYTNGVMCYTSESLNFFYFFGMCALHCSRYFADKIVATNNAPGFATFSYTFWLFVAVFLGLHLEIQLSSSDMKYSCIFLLLELRSVILWTR